MLNLDLMQSRAGQDIYRMGEMHGKQIGLIEGKLEGERLMLQRLLEKRFGQLPRPVQIRLENATLTELDQWSSMLLTADSLGDIFNC